MTGGAVRLAPIGEAGVLGIAEGIETALSVMKSCPGLPVWAALSAGNLEQVQLPAEATNVVILADNDGEGAGPAAARRAAARLHQRRPAHLDRPAANVGDDFNDLLQQQGPDAVRQAVEAAAEWLPETGPRPEAEDARPVGDDFRPLGFREPAALPHLRADDGDLARLALAGLGAAAGVERPAVAVPLPPAGRPGSCATTTAVPSLIR